MKLPSDWITIVILGLASWRVFNLFAYDKILDRPRRWLLRLGDWQEETDPHHHKLPEEYRIKWAIFLTCPYCAGFWIALGWFTAWQITAFWTLVVAFPFALNTAVVALAKILTPED